MPINPVPYTIGAGLGISEGYHFGHKKDKKDSYNHAALGAALGAVGGPLGVHAGQKQIKDLVTVAKEIMHESGLAKKAAELPSLHKVPKISDMVEDESPAMVASSLGLGTGAGMAGYHLSSAAKLGKAPAALVAASMAALGDQEGRVLYHKLLEKKMKKSHNKYLREATRS